MPSVAPARHGNSSKVSFDSEKNESTRYEIDLASLFWAIFSDLVILADELTEYLFKSIGGNVMYDYGWEKLHLAMHSLAGQGTQKERLISAVVYNLIHITPKNDLPEEIHDEFNDFMRDITSVAAKGNEGSIQATVNTLDEIAVSRAVEKIIGFYDKVCRHSDS